MTIADLTHIRALLVTTDTIRKTQAFLRKRGKEDVEAIVLWVGRPESSTTFRVTRPIFPEQHGTLISVKVDASEIQRIDDDCRARGEVIGAQLHTHPNAAFHSPTDDATPIVSKIGAYSMVIPDFAKAPITDLSRAVVVQLRGEGWSEELAENERSRLIQVDR
jgi:proteasome lid subunit RPN8/RPN11